MPKQSDFKVAEKQAVKLVSTDKTGLTSKQQTLQMVQALKDHLMDLVETGTLEMKDVKAGTETTMLLHDFEERLTKEMSEGDD